MCWATAGDSFLSRADARVKLLCLLLYFVAALHARSVVALAACALAALAGAIATRLDVSSIAKAVLPFAVIVVVTLVMQVLYIQQGEVIAQFGPIAVTTGALAAAGAMLVSLLCVLAMSLAFMRCTSTEQLTSAFGWLLAPLGKLGLRVDAFMLALSVAFRFVPVLVEDFVQLKRAQSSRLAAFDGSVGKRLNAYMRLFPPLVRGSFRRADHLAEAFLSRCFGSGLPRTSLHELHTGWRDVLLLVPTVAILAVSFV